MKILKDEQPVTEPWLCKRLANAIKEVVKEEFSLPKDKIPGIAAKKLGFSSTGTKINDVINKTIDLLEKNAVLVVTNGQVTNA